MNTALKKQKNVLLSWVVCFSAALFFAYELMQFHMLNAIAPMLLKEFNIGATKFGYLCSTYLLADVIFLLPAGIILDRFSTRKVILVALSFCIIGTFGFATAQTFNQACLCHFLSGIGNAFCFLSCMMLVSRWFPVKKRAFIMGLMVTVGLLGGVVAQSPFSYLAETLKWRNALLVDGALGIALFALIFFLVKDRKQQEITDEIENEIEKSKLPFFTGLKKSVVNRQNILCGLYTGFMNLPVMIIGAVWGSLFLTQIHGLPLAKASLVVSMICTGTIVGSPIFGYISDKLQKRVPLMLIGAVSSLLIFAFILLTPQPTVPILSTLFFLLGLFTSSQVIGYPTITESNPANLTGTSMGVAAVIIMGLPMLLQPITGKLIELNWNGSMANGMPLYSLHDFFAAFSIFPIGFILSFILARLIKEPKGKAIVKEVEEELDLIELS
ncbi:MAG: MFS transporter [Rhabdochlamydiaceae bacterium]|nr:MFS transporter [Candidatus Amphrikana amoebophyrae]